MPSQRFESSVRVCVISYVLVVIGFAVSFILAHDITKKETVFANPSVAIYYTLLYTSSTVCLIYLDLYLKCTNRPCSVTAQNNSRHNVNDQHIETNETSRDSVKPPNGSRRGDEVSPVNDVDAGNDSLELKKDTNAKVAKGINFYFLLGGLCFAVGAVILDLFTLSTMRQECVDYHIMLVIATHLILTITEMVFVVRKYDAVVEQMNLACRFAIVHVVATNICIWIVLSVGEALDFYIHEYKLLIHNTTIPNGSCQTAKHLRGSVGVYLAPCLIEHSLFMIPVFHNLYTHMVEGKVKLTHHVTQRKFRKIVLMVQRVHVGFLVIVLTVSSQAVFLYTVNNIENSSIARPIFLSTQIFLVSITIAMTIVSLYKFEKLGFNAAPPMSFDEYLLFITMGGYVLFNVCRLIPAIFSLLTGVWASAWSPVLIVIASFLSVVQCLIQTMFITIAKRTYAVNDEQKIKKPGRSAIGFLVVSNLSLWSTLTFEIRESTVDVVYTSYYGELPWLMLTFGTIPFVIFYLFHSTVCYSDVWKEAYEDKVDE